MLPKRARKAALVRFSRDESGAILLFSLVMFLPILVAAGMAMDFMHAESRRVRLQAVLDRAVLAAADIGQDLSAEDVVRDHFAREGLAGELISVDVSEDLLGRVVSARAEIGTKTILLRLLGQDRIVAQASGTARERSPNLEISLVLDISGSMRFDDRISSLRLAAKQFVSAVLPDGDEERVSVSLIPYAGQVNPEPTLFEALGGVRLFAPEETETVDGAPLPVSTGSCLEIPPSAFAQTGFPRAWPGSPFFQVPHFMYWEIASEVMDWGWCPEDDTAIRFASNDRDALHGMIDGLRMHDGTGTHYAMKYALAALDPGSSDLFSLLAARGEIPPLLADRPAPWDDLDTAKYVVLMTDGKITDQWRPADPGDPLNAVEELQPRRSVHYKRLSAASENVSSFLESCQAARDRGVVVFTIAYEAPAGASDQMRACASSPGHFFEASQADIGEVFATIAGQIQHLRLIQ